MLRVIISLIVGLAIFWGIAMVVPQSTGEAFKIAGYSISFCLILGLIAFGFTWKHVK